MTTKVFTSQGERFLQAKLLTVLFLVHEKYFARVYAHLLELHALPPPSFYHALLLYIGIAMGGGPTLQPYIRKTRLEQNLLMYCYGY